jgi:plastocyanin
MGRLVAIVVAAAAALIVVLAINGPGKDKPQTEAQAPHREAPAVAPAGGTGKSATAHARVGATVVMRGLAFVNPAITVRRGQAVRWVNHDNVSHAIIEDLGAVGGEAPLFASRRIVPGRSFVWVASAAGTYRFVCPLHPTVMQGRVVVTASA